MNIFQQIVGSPLRFFGFLSTVIFLLTASWRWSSGIFQGYTWYSNLAPLGFILSSILLYIIAFKTNDLKSENTFLSRLVGSPIKLLALTLILWGTITLVYLIGWIHFESAFIWPISAGSLLYLMEYVLVRIKMTKKTYLIIQSVSVLVAGLFLLFSLVHSTARTDFITSNKDEFIIVYEIEGQPPLPRTVFWRKEIQIPENGILMTSSSVLELPGYRKNYFDQEGNNIRLYRQYNSEYCSDNQTVVSVDYYTSKLKSYHIPCGQTKVQIAFQYIFDSICKGEIKSNFMDTTSPKYRHETRDIWCKKYKKNIIEEN
ncbi:MAG: hypothetical protein R3279_10235 [Putridiphycobacter sp.]|nr:hypothetical protein [Putridiphycobacter sp.]